MGHSAFQILPLQIVHPVTYQFDNNLIQVLISKGVDIHNIRTYKNLAGKRPKNEILRPIDILFGFCPYLISLRTKMYNKNTVSHFFERKGIHSLGPLQANLI